jgi:peroxiredoxin-like protein
VGHSPAHEQEEALMGQLEARATVRWSGYTGSVAGDSGALSAVTATQSELGGPGTGTNPEELLAAAHANCFTSTLTALGRAHRVPLEEVETSARTRLEWDDEAHDHHLAASELTLRIRSSAGEEAVKELVRKAELQCPVCKALSGNVRLSVSLEVEPI